jgi:RNA polymerase sigma-70 factor (ECF subfamily)
VTPSSASDANSAEVPLLTRRLAAGDESAFREFHARYFDRLYRFLLVVTRGDQDAAQEALQQTLLRVARHAREFSDEDIFWSWLKAVARNAALDGGRKRRRYLALMERFAFRIDSPEAVAPKADERWREVLDEALAEMSDEDRALIAGKYLEGASVRELAEGAGLTEKTVETRLFRLRRALGERILRKLRTR